MNTLLTTFTEQLIEWLPSVLGALSIGLLFLIGAIIANRVIKRLANHVSNNKKPVLDLLARVAKIGILSLGLVTVLGSLGINVNALIASIGLTGFALGFALKDALSNVLAGLLILLYQPFKIGDRITVSSFAATSFTGDVKDINLRYTSLLAEGESILVPNSTILNNVVKVGKNKLN